MPLQFFFILNFGYLEPSTQKIWPLILVWNWIYMLIINNIFLNVNNSNLLLLLKYDFANTMIILIIVCYYIIVYY